MAFSNIQKLLILSSHAAMQGVGAWWAMNSSAPESETSPKSKESLDLVSSEHRVSPTRLLAAFRYDSPHYQAIQAKATSEEYVKPEVRAAEVTDFEKELQAQVDVFNQTGFTDHMFTKEVIYRWMSVDPAAALRFFGTVEIRSGWGDPWPALFKDPCALDGLQIASIVKESWLPYNLGRGRDPLAAMIGKHHPEQVLDVLDLFDDDPDVGARFLDQAFRSARGGDLETWLGIIAQFDPVDQEALNEKLAKNVIPSDVPRVWLYPELKNGRNAGPSYDEVAEAIAHARGTDLESLVEPRWQSLLAEFERQKGELAAAEGDSTSRSSLSPPSDSRQEELSSRSRAEMQALFDGEVSGATVLGSQLARLEQALPKGRFEQQSAALLSEVILLDPVSTLEIAPQHFTEEQIKRAFQTLNRSSQYSIQGRAQMLDELIVSAHWQDIPDRNKFLGRVIMDYREHHLDLARSWVRNLPPESLDAAKASQPQYTDLHNFIDQALEE